MTTLDPDAIERREREARRWAQRVCRGDIEALCDDIKALREALAEAERKARGPVMDTSKMEAAQRTRRNREARARQEAKPQ